MLKKTAYRLGGCVWIALCLLLAAASVGAQNLLTNPGFEEVPNNRTEESLLPSHWFHVLQTADTYSVDGSYGLSPQHPLRTYFSGAIAPEGIRWVAGGQADDETFGQRLAAELVPGERYRWRALLRRSTSLLTQDGGFCIQLGRAHGDEVVYVEACCLDPTSGEVGWQERYCSFVVPEQEPAPAFVAITPRSEHVGAYIGIDDMLLEVACGNGILEGPFETCDDSNRVDGDCCSASCLRSLEPGAPCPGRNDACNPATCTDEGVCRENPVECVDAHPNDCLASACNPATGQCEVSFLPGFHRCDSDADLCTLEFCDALGQCLVGQREVCDDGDPCNGIESCIHDEDPDGGSVPILLCKAGEPLADESPCVADGIACTVDACRLGRCAHFPSDTLCDDGFECTLDRCDLSAGGCLNKPENGNCQDDIACTRESCSPGTPDADGRGCVFEAMDATCDDGDLCTVDRCYVTVGCLSDAEPRSVCNIAEGSLDLRDPGDDAGDRFTWRWGRIGAGPLAAAQLGTPAWSVATHLDYALCIWDHRPGAVKPVLWSRLDIPPGLQDPNPAGSGWRVLNGGLSLQYKDPQASADGVRRLLLKSSEEPNRASAILVGEGPNLPFQQPAWNRNHLMAQSPRVQVQLVNELGLCLETSFETGEVIRNDVDRFRAAD